MSRFINEPPLPENRATNASIPVDNRLPRTEEAPKSEERGPSAPRGRPSFLIILLRALSAPHA